MSFINIPQMETTTSDPRFRTWPITSTKSIEPMLKKMGLELDAEMIDGTSGAERALSDALVSVGTGKPPLLHSNILFLFLEERPLRPQLTTDSMHLKPGGAGPARL